jgi:ubiquinone/menaquinone biosynthesis C-methylase UbiE
MNIEREHEMALSEAEVQVLATLFGAESGYQPVDKASLEKSGKIYWIYLEDWSDAFSSLIDKDLISGSESGYYLTESGRPLARSYREERPDDFWYYYQQFYEKAHISHAHTRFCEQVYGMDLCQEGLMDMESIHDLIDRLKLKPGQRLLDLGCGAGGISEYISDQTGAHVTGLDSSASAISTARARTENKHSQLKFIEADLNTLDLEPLSYDAAISIDTIYWVNDTYDSLKRIVRSLKPGGQLFISIVHILEYCDSPEELEIDKTYVALALDKLQLDYQSVDRTESFLGFWPRVKKTMLELKQDFDREGNGLIYQHWIKDADAEFLPAIQSNDLRRYLYHVQV